MGSSPEAQGWEDSAWRLRAVGGFVEAGRHLQEVGWRLINDA